MTADIQSPAETPRCTIGHEIFTGPGESRRLRTTRCSCPRTGFAEPTCWPGFGFRFGSKFETETAQREMPRVQRNSLSEIASKHRRLDAGPEE